MTSAELTPDQLRRDPVPLRGRVAVVTGVSRRAGIGYAIARRLAALGASLFLHQFAPHDRDQRWGADPGGPEAVIAGVTAARADEVSGVRHVEADLTEPGAPERLIDAAGQAFGHLDILVSNHARSGGDGPLGTLTAAMLDAHWAVNTRSVRDLFGDLSGHIRRRKVLAAGAGKRCRVLTWSAGSEIGNRRRLSARTLTIWPSPRTSIHCGENPSRSRAPSRPAPGRPCLLNRCGERCSAGVCMPSASVGRKPCRKRPAGPGCRRSTCPRSSAAGRNRRAR